MKAFLLETTYSCATVFVDSERKIVKADPIYCWIIGKNLDLIERKLIRKGKFVSLVELDNANNESKNKRS